MKDIFITLEQRGWRNGEGYILLWLLPRELHKLPFHLPFITYILRVLANDLDDNFFFFFFFYRLFVFSREKRHEKLPDRKRF